MNFEELMYFGKYEEAAKLIFDKSNASEKYTNEIKKKNIENLSIKLKETADKIKKSKQSGRDNIEKMSISKRINSKSDTKINSEELKSKELKTLEEALKNEEMKQYKQIGEILSERLKSMLNG